MNDFTTLEHPVDFCSLCLAKVLPHPSLLHCLPSTRILHLQKLKIHPHLGCGTCMQVFGGNRKDYLECVNLSELIETPCSFIATSLAQRAPFY